MPYLALGADYTSNYDDRTTLRLYASLFNMLGVMICMILPTLFVDYLENCGLSTDRAWSVSGLVLGIVSAGSILITVAACRTKDPACPASEKVPGLHRFEPIKILKEYLAVLKLHPVKYLVAASVLSLAGYAMLMASMMYYFTYYMGLGPSGTSALLLIRALTGMLLIPVTGAIARRIDKKWALILAYGTGIVLLTFLRFSGVSGIPGTAIYVLGVALLTAVYWQLIPSMYYDICEYDLWKTGHERQATIVSLQGLVEAVAVGLGSLLLGMILGAAGFNEDVLQQCDTALNWILNCTTIIPAAFYIAASVVLAKYPLDRDAYQEILEELSKRS